MWAPHSVVRVINQSKQFVVLRELSVFHPAVNEAKAMRHLAEVFIRPFALLFT
jgi:hypothetical protein